MRVVRQTPPDQARINTLVGLGLERRRGKPDRTINIPAALRPELSALSGRANLTAVEQTSLEAILKDHQPRKDRTPTPKSNGALIKGRC